LFVCDVENFNFFSLELIWRHIKLGGIPVSADHLRSRGAEFAWKCCLVCDLEVFHITDLGLCVAVIRNLNVADQKEIAASTKA
jgi:hypothetical protein